VDVEGLRSMDETLDFQLYPGAPSTGSSVQFPAWPWRSRYQAFMACSVSGVAAQREIGSASRSAPVRLAAAMILRQSLRLAAIGAPAGRSPRLAFCAWPQSQIDWPARPGAGAATFGPSSCWW